MIKKVVIFIRWLLCVFIMWFISGYLIVILFSLFDDNLVCGFRPKPCSRIEHAIDQLFFAAPLLWPFFIVYKLFDIYSGIILFQWVSIIYNILIISILLWKKDSLWKKFVKVRYAISYQLEQWIKLDAHWSIIFFWFFLALFVPIFAVFFLPSYLRDLLFLFR